MKKKEELLLIKNRIRENLISDSEKLEVLIPLLEDETHKNSIDNTFKIESPTDLLLDYLHGLISSPKSKIVNEPKIELIRKWLNLRESTNKQMSLYSRVDFIKENKHELRTTIRKLIRLFE